MSIAISKLLKRDVFAVNEGLRLGRAQDVLIDQDEHKIALVVLNMRGVPHTATVIDADDVRSWAEDTLPVEGVTSTRLAHEVPEAIELVERNLHFRGRDVFSTSGHKLGRIIDVVIDDRGKVTEYQVASNMFKRLFHITDSVAPDNVKTAGTDVAVVSQPEASKKQEGSEKEARSEADTAANSRQRQH